MMAIPFLEKKHSNYEFVDLIENDPHEEEGNEKRNST